MITEREQLIKCGFKGFKAVRELMNSCKDIPKEMGVYVILHEKNDHPVILDKRPFDCQEEKYPSYSKAELENEWVEGAHIVYIGKAGGFDKKTHLHKRLRAYIGFGKGKKVAHGGGRSIWQLINALDLVVCWKVITDEEPSDVEHKMIAEFKAAHSGKRPFANLKD